MYINKPLKIHPGRLLKQVTAMLSKRKYNVISLRRAEYTERSRRVFRILLNVCDGAFH